MLIHFKNWIGLSLVLFGILLPYPIYSLGLEKGILFPLVEPILFYLLDLLFDYQPKIINGYSDGKIVYLLFSFCFILSSILLYINQIWFKTASNKIYMFCVRILIFLTAFFLLKYGFDKVIGNQFPLPEGNLLNTQLKYLEKDILFWTAMSGSSVYLQFMGWIEIIPACLLLIPFTRKIGLLISFGVLTNVLFVNIGFDITVKLISFYLVCCVLFVLTYYWKALKPLFFSGFSYQKVVLSPLISNPKLRYTFTSLIVFIFLFESVKPHLKGQEKNAINASYTFKDNSLYTILNIENIKSIHVHSDHFLILEQYVVNQPNAFKSFPIQIKNLGDSAQIYIPALSKTCVIKGKDDIQFIADKDTLLLKKVDFSNLPFFKDNFNLFLEDFMLQQ